MQLISDAKLKKLKDAFVSAKRKRASGDFICWALERVMDSQEAIDLVESRLGSSTLGTFMEKRGLLYEPKNDSMFDKLRDLWLNMLINEHSSHDMYLLARYRDYLINLRDRGFTTSHSTIVSGFAQWCVNKFDSEYYGWLIETRKSKKLWQRVRNQECCPELQKFIQQEILEVTNILIQEPK
jgi:hypothetical protein